MMFPEKLDDFFVIAVATTARFGATVVQHADMLVCLHSSAI
jgi:hypothetical protein